MSPSPADDPRAERTLWEGHPSPLLIAPALLGASLAALGLLGCGLELDLPLGVSLAVGLVPLAWGVLRWLQNASEVYRVTSERLILRTGILSRATEETELYRVTDYRLVEPFLPRLLGLGELEITTSDESRPLIRLRGLRGVAALRDELRTHVEVARDRKRVRVTELE